MSQLDVFLATADTAALVWSLGYDQSNRLDFRDGGETDCSAFVIICAEDAGLLPKNNIRKGIGATYTGNMAAAFAENDWQVFRPALAQAQLKAGDVVLNDAYHTMIYDGSQLIGARMDENGHISGGASGDQTGEETLRQPYYDYPWTATLRPPASARSLNQASNLPVSDKLEVDGVMGPATIKALQKALGTQQDGVISFPKSTMVVALQNFLNTHGAKLDVDGVWGTLTTRALQTYLGTYVDGVISKPLSAVIEKLQIRLNMGEL